jgi:hypothetical protein
MARIDTASSACSSVSNLLATTEPKASQADADFRPIEPTIELCAVSGEV